MELQLKQKNALLYVVLIAGCMWRLVLSFYYSGWEESDYGNLAMVYGVWESGFTHYDMNHMPGYYFFAALGLFFTDDTIVAATAASLLGGCLSFVGIVHLMRHHFGTLPALITATLLMIQPEFSLYSASSLREPVYTAFVVAALGALLRNNAVWYGTFGALAFSVRFEAPLFLVPIGLLYLSSWRKKATAMGILSGAIVLWMLYCSVVHDTAQFWSHAAAVNVETGLGAEQESTFGWAMAGAQVVWGLFTDVVPDRFGWPLWAMVWMLPWFLVGSRTAKILWVWMLLMVGQWCAIAFVAQHEPQHNLYWKWFYPVTPFVAAVGGLVVPRVLGWATPRHWPVVGVILYTLWVQSIETHRQFRLSERLYKPQVELGRWIEENVADSTPLLLDNIPACWIGRKPHEYTLHSWFDVPVFNTEQELLQWLQ